MALTIPIGWASHPRSFWLSSTTVICSDQTGTLTENQMTVQAIHAGGQHYRVSGGGYSPKGDITLAEAVCE